MCRVLYPMQRFKLLLCFAKQLTVVSVASQPPSSPQKTVGVPLNVALGQQILTVQQSAPSSPGKAVANHTPTQVQTAFYCPVACLCLMALVKLKCWTPRRQSPGVPVAVNWHIALRSTCCFRQGLPATAPTKACCWQAAFQPGKPHLLQFLISQAIWKVSYDARKSS